MSEEAESDTSFFTRISRGAFIFLVGKIVNKGSLFLLNGILIYGVGTTAYGVYTYAKSIFTVILMFSDLGTVNSIMRFIPAYQADKQKQNQILGLSFLTIVVCSVLFAGTVFYFSPLITERTLGDEMLTTTLQLMMLSLPLFVVVKVSATVFRSIDLPEYQVFLSSVCRPGFQLVLVGAAAVFLGTLTDIVIAFIISGIALVLVSLIFFILYTPFIPTLRGTTKVASEFYNFSLPITLNKAGSIMYSRADILMVGLFLPSAAVGIYNIAVLVSQLVSLPLSAFGQLFPPVASELYSEGKINELSILYSRVTRWMFTIALLPGLAVIVYAETVLRIFGSEFTTGTSILVLFSIAQLMNAAVGPSGHLLMMTNHQYLTMVNQWIIGLLNIVLNYFLLQEYGLVGAALATAGALALINIVRVVELWYTEGLVPYREAFFKPISAGIIAGGAMEAGKLFFSGYLLPIVGTAVGGALFVAVLYILGIEQDDVEFFKNVLPTR